MLRPIQRLGHVGLHQCTQPVERVTSEIERLVEDMIETMYAAPGIGLAGPQVGVPLRVFVIDLSVGEEPGSVITMINPEFVERSGMQLEQEGCLSLPGFTATVARPQRVVVKGLDRTGREHRVEATGLLARAFQHEMDHLDGRLFIDRLRGIKRGLIQRQVRKLTRAGKW
jgi:peptide deformylase